MTGSSAQKAVIIGGGIVGLSTAIWLSRYGLDVTLVDRHPVGDPRAASFGNAGVLAACSVAPVTAPGLVRKAPKLLLDPDFPLFLRWSYLPRLVPWLLRYLANANDEDTRRIAKGLAPLIYDSVDQHKALAAGTDANDWVQPSDYGFVYPTRAAFEADGYTWALRREAGFEPEVIEGAAVREVEPCLAPNLGLLAVMKDHAFVRDPGAYLGALAKEAEALGVEICQARVNDVDLREDRVAAIITDQGRHECDVVVLAAGVWSKRLTEKLGLHVPLESERGYHIQFENTNVMPKVPLMVTTGKFVATPMTHGLRCAGIVEFGGLDAPMSKAPLALLRKKAKETFPALEAGEETTWLGHRPAPPDSLPVIGEIRNTGVFAGFGHHHVGLTAGPKTGRIIAGLVTGNRENIDLEPYRPGRFAARGGAP